MVLLHHVLAALAIVLAILVLTTTSVFGWDVAQELGVAVLLLGVAELTEHGVSYLTNRRVA